MKVIVTTSKETRHIETVTSAKIEIGGGYQVTINDNDLETTIDLEYPDGADLRLEHITKVDRDG